MAERKTRSIAKVETAAMPSSGTPDLMRPPTKASSDMTSYATSTEYIADQPRIAESKAKRLIEAHNLPWKDFVLDYGVCESYKTKHVFDWMGY